MSLFFLASVRRVVKVYNQFGNVICNFYGWIIYLLINSSKFRFIYGLYVLIGAFSCAANFNRVEVLSI
jgi:hypothetical protein